MRRKRSLISLLLVLVLLIGAYVYLSNRPEEEEETEPKQVIDISKVDREKIVKIALENKETGEQLVFEQETRTIEGSEQNSDEEKESKTETVWVTTKPYAVELVQSKVTDLARSFSSLTANLVVEEQPEDLSIYGLKEPKVIATATLDDGETIVLHLGNKTADGSGWYLMKKGDSKVYTVGTYHGDRLSLSFSDYRSKDLAVIDPLKMNYMRITGADRREIEIVTNDDLTDEEEAYGLNLYYMIKPFKKPRGVDSTKLGERLEKVTSLKIKEFVDDHPSDYSKYGLDEPKLNLLIKDQDGTTLDLSFGSSLEDGTIYFKTGDSDAVYLMDESSIEFLNFAPMDVADKFALLVNIDDVDQVVFEGRGRRHTLSIERTTVEAEEEGEEDKEVSTYYLDGREVEEKPFKSFYQSIIGIVVDTEKAHTAEGRPDLKLTYHLNKGTRDRRTVELIPHDQDFYSLVVDGDMESEFLIFRNRLDWVFGALDEFIAGSEDAD